MKIIKLDKRYQLGRAGLIYALTWRWEVIKSVELRHKLYWEHGEGWSIWNQDRIQNPVWGWYTMPKKDHRHFIAFREEKYLTALLLSMRNL
jgi:hypothetical protein